MTTLTLKEIERTYKNNGQHAEQVFRFTVEGQIFKADNKPAEVAGDCLDIQIKSAKATVCHGTNLKAYLEMDAAKRYAYVNSDFTLAYIMTKAEWLEFCTKFAKVARESTKNGGKEKLRLGTETKEVRAWFENRI